MSHLLECSVKAVTLGLAAFIVGSILDGDALKAVYWLFTLV